MATGTLAKRFHVSGRVQGVGYRYFAQRVALRMRIAGYVQNLDDGRVEVYAIGTSEQLAELLDELRRGPFMARVVHIEEIEAEMLTEYAGDFRIER